MIAAGLSGVMALCVPAAFGQAATMAFGEVVSALATARSRTEQLAALLKLYKADDVEGRRLYADAKAKFDGVISGLQAGVDQTGSTDLSPTLKAALDGAVRASVIFSEHVDGVLRAILPPNGKSPWAALLADPAKLLKALVDSGLAIFQASRGANREDRKRISDRLEQERWRNYSDIPAAK